MILRKKKSLNAGPINGTGEGVAHSKRWYVAVSYTHLTYANDLAQAIFAIINKGIVPGVYHFSNEGVCSWYDFTVAIHRLAGITSCKVKPLHTSEYPTRANRPAYSVLDKTKIKTTFGIEIPHWEESLKRCIDTL